MPIHPTSFALLLGTALAASGRLSGAATERVIYKHNVDRNLAMTILKPPDWTAADRRPGFVFFYNGGWQDPTNTKPQFNEQAAYFAARGMLVAQADYREKSRGGVTSAFALADIHDAMRWLRARSADLRLDPGRIAAAAGSGSIHLAAAFGRADAGAAPIAGGGSSPAPGALFLFDADLDVLDPAMMQRLLLHRDEPGAWRDFPPTIFFYGGRDALRPSAEDFIARARTAGLPIEPFMADDGLHGAFKFTPWLEKTTARVDARLRELGFLEATPAVALPTKAKPPGLDEKVLANQARWLERHRQLQAQRSAGAPVGPRAVNPREAGTAEPPAREFVYKTAGGRPLTAALHYPEGWNRSDARPAIALFSGGGFNPTDRPETRDPSEGGGRVGAGGGGPAAGMIPVAEYFAGRGMVALRFDYRKRRSDGVYPDKAFEDACSAIRWLRRNASLLGVDPARIVVCGGSSGGHLAASLAALAEFDAPDEDPAISRRPDAMILHSPLLDFLEGGTRNLPFLAALDNDRELGRRLSPARHWRKDLPPTLLFTGAKEPIFDALCQFANRWQAAGHRIELVKGEGGHVSSLNEKFLGETLPRMEAFLRTHGFLGAAAGLTAAPPVPSEPPPESVVYKQLGARELQLALHYPPGWSARDRRTGMLFFSGGHRVVPDSEGRGPPLAAERVRLGLPVVNSGPGKMHAPFCDQLARRGLVVARVEYRTRGRDGVLPGEDIADAVDAMRWFRRHADRLGIDPARVVAAGGSSGAYLAAGLFAFEDRFPEAASPAVSARPDGIVLNSPLVDWLEVGTMSDAFLFVLDGDKELGARISPARHWRPDCPPTLVLLGSEEPQVAGVREFANKWKDAGAPVTLFEAEGGEHGFFWKPEWIERTLTRTEEFLRANGFLSSSTAPAAQTRLPARSDPEANPAANVNLLAALLARFPAADANQDGVLTKEEAAAFRAKKQAGKKSAK